MRYLVTGTAGFIGFHVARRLLGEGHFVTGFDGMTSYYDIQLKQRRHATLKQLPGFEAVEGMLEDSGALDDAFDKARPEIVIHLAAQAGVRHSIDKPRDYVSANLAGTLNVLECCRAGKPKHFVFSSTSSVYGMSSKLEFVETDETDRPISFYAATKKAGEVMAHSYAHLFGIPTTACRFFTVYGPNGRPDMSLFKFVRAIVNDEPIDVYGKGIHERDFTFIDDLVEAIVRLSRCIPELGEPVEMDGVTDTLSHSAPYREVNIAGGRTVGLMRYINTIEQILGRKARLNMLPVQPGDVQRTTASTALLLALTGYRPDTDIRSGLEKFIEWYLSEIQPSTV